MKWESLRWLALYDPSASQYIPVLSRIAVNSSLKNRTLPISSGNGGNSAYMLYVQKKYQAVGADLRVLSRVILRKNASFKVFS